ncbi:MAG TPA: TonB-dependent receptor [Burkholderiales bacterium]|nr:TonB-dependent receptor [Burkholderiales bacterium]
MPAKSSSSARIFTTGSTILLLSSLGALAQDAAPSADGPVQLAPIVVTPTRTEQSSFDLPTAVNVIDAETIQDQRPAVSVAETLVRVPGTVVQNREALSQEQQIIVRGFGARAGFGIRGIKLLADGIPASTPDGQGGTGLFDLGSARSIEVMRGPFSALYGNHSGGVVQIFTEDGPDRPTLTPYASFGSFDTWKGGIKFGGTMDSGLNYIANASRFETDGYRDHSSATKDQFNAKLASAVGDSTRLTFVLNYLDQPLDEDPLGLTAAEVQEDRKQAAPDAYTFNTRRSLSNLQSGLVVESRVTDADTLRGMVYLGERDNVGYLAIAAAAQNSRTAAGGVSAIARDFWGAGVRWTHQAEVASRPFTVTVGADYDQAVDQRKGYLNNDGEQGALKRDEENTVDSYGAYVQGEWKVAERWTVSAGLRYTDVSFDSRDNFICTTTVNTTGTPLGTCSGTTLPITATQFNPDDSGSVSYDAWTPVAGVVYQLTSTTNLYANYGESFETPTFIELGYKADGTSGLNFALKPSTSKHYEVGMKTFLGDWGLLEAAAFKIDTEDEIVVLTNAGGRQTYQNAGRTARQGFELSASSQFAHGFAGYLSATYLDATFEDSFNTCSGLPAPCTVPANVVAAGNRIPGVPRYTVFGEVSWRYAPWGFSTGFEARWHGDVMVDDVNSEKADDYFVAAVRAGFRQASGDWRFSEFARVDNLFDEEYIGAVLVNGGNGRFYAPAAERSYTVGLTASYSF